MHMITLEEFEEMGSARRGRITIRCGCFYFACAGWALIDLTDALPLRGWESLPDVLGPLDKGPHYEEEEGFSQTLLSDRPYRR